MSKLPKQVVLALAAVAALEGSGCSPSPAPKPAGDARSASGTPTASAPAQPLELSLMTFNLRFDNPKDGVNAWPNRKDMVLDVLREQDADVVGFQEGMPHQHTDIGPPAPYRQLGVARADGREGGGELSAVIYKSDRFDVDESGTFWLSPTPEVPGSTGWGNNVPRICTWAHLTDKKAHRSFYFFNTHLDHESQPARAKGVELIVSRMAARTHKDEPVVFVGDLNSDETNPVVHYLTGKAPRASEGSDPVPPSPGFVDTFRVLHPDEKNAGTFNYWRGETKEGKIDFIFVPAPPATEVLKAEIVHTSRDGRYPSDHYPVVARVRLR